MSTHTVSRLTIVEAAQPATRRLSAESTPTTRGSSSKRARHTSEGKPVKKRTAARKILSSPKAKVKAMTRTGKSSAVAPGKQTRRQAKAAIAIAPVLPIAIEIPPRAAEQIEPQPSFAVEEIPVEPTFSELTVASEESSVETVENNIHAELELSIAENTNTEMDVIAEPQLDLAEATASSGIPVPSVVLAQPESIRRTFPFQWNTFLQVLAKGWNWLQRRLKTQQSKKRLRVCESVSLGEKRFIAVVQVDGEQFLVGGSSSSVSTLAHLEQPREFADVFRRYGQSGMQA